MRVRVARLPSGERGLVATQHIAAGEEIVVEAPAYFASCAGRTRDDEGHAALAAQILASTSSSRSDASNSMGTSACIIGPRARSRPVHSVLIVTVVSDLQGGRVVDCGHHHRRAPCGSDSPPEVPRKRVVRSSRASGDGASVLVPVGHCFSGFDGWSGRKVCRCSIMS